MICEFMMKKWKQTFWKANNRCLPPLWSPMGKFSKRGVSREIRQTMLSSALDSDHPHKPLAKLQLIPEALSRNWGNENRQRTKLFKIAIAGLQGDLICKWTSPLPTANFGISHQTVYKDGKLVQIFYMMKFFKVANGIYSKIAIIVLSFRCS